MAASRRSRSWRRGVWSGALLLVLLTACTLGFAYWNKARCVGPEFDQWGRSEPGYQQRSYARVCYSDIQHLWIGRDIDRHVFPYIHGGITNEGALFGGVVEYPVLSGLLIWAGALAVDTDAGFLAASALLLTPFGLAIAWWLGRLSRWRALLWAIGPPVVLYAFHNWDLPAVACATGAVFLMHKWRASLRTRGVVAAILLGLGFAFKIYPGLFVLPLCLYVFTGGPGGTEVGELGQGGTGAHGKRFDFRGAGLVAGAACGTVLLVNLPFALAGFDGWLASFQYQSQRQVDLSTNSIWYWGSRGLVGDAKPIAPEAFQQFVSIASPVFMLVSFAVACGVGWRTFLRRGTFPWIQVSAAMLCGFLLLHKVHSPQYTLWLLPFFVLVSMRWGWVVSYLVADLAMSIGVFRWLYLVSAGHSYGVHDGLAAQALMLGVWGRAALLVGLFVAFLAGRATPERDAGRSVYPMASPRSMRAT